MASNQSVENPIAREENFYPLTSLQQSMYASANLTRRPWCYVEQIVVSVSYDLDVQALSEAWLWLARNHSALRNTVSVNSQGDLQQETRPVGPIVPELEDWRSMTSKQCEQRLSHFLAVDRERGVDAANFPAFRATIISTANETSKLIWTFPHSLLDGRSFAPLLEELFQHYQNIQRGLRPATEQKVDPDVFAEHCRKLAEIPHTKGVAFFEDLLSGWEVSTGLVEVGKEPSRKRQLVNRLSKEQCQSLSTLARKSDATMSSVILGAWGTVVARFTGQRDAVFGNTRNGRHLVPGSKDAAGCFITTVPVRVKLEKGMTVRQLLSSIRKDQISSRSFEHTPLTAIQRQLQVPPGRSLIESVVMFEHGTLETQLMALGGDWEKNTVTLLEEGDTPVTIAAYQGEQLQVDVEFDPAQVPEGQRLASYLTQFLTALAAAEPDTPLAAVSMLPPEETAELHELAGAEIDTGNFLTCIERFEQTAAAYPDKPALVQSGRESISYKSLDDRANSLAAHLSHAGVRPGNTVGICMPRGWEFVVSLVAVWKVGAAFVPMDPSYPVDTLNTIAEDSKVRLILTSDDSPELSIQPLNFNSLADPPSSSGRLKSSSICPDQTAYVIFTSGSTGRPKGVMVSHRSLSAHCEAATHLFELTHEDRVLQFAALSFDVALEEVIPTLANGATLVFRNDEMSLSARGFLEECAQHRVTVMNLPTGFWGVLADQIGSYVGDIHSELRLVVVGGERIPLQALKRWREYLPELRWINGYGPTETTITCTAYEAPLGKFERQNVPIGRPLAHARAWILAKDGSLAPAGTEGELHISGPAVTKGYIGNADATKRNFGNAAFDVETGLTYATGDRVVWQDGQLLFLGRQDRQIKLRGFRIEPGQIEGVLEAHEQVSRAYVALYTPTARQPQLVAWYSTTAEQPELSTDLLHRWVMRFLPPHMQPELIEVSSWPQTAGGKMDIGKLPPPVASESITVDRSNTLMTPLIEEIATVFSDLTGLGNVGTETSFFEAGGDSLSLLKLISVLEDRFKIHLKPTALYSDPTPAGVARALQAQDPDPLVVIPIQDTGELPPLYGVHVLGDNGSYYRPLAAELGRNQPMYGLTVGLLTASTPTQVADIARFYLCQIERHYPKGPFSLIAVSAGSYVTLELAQQLLQAGRDVQALILLDAEGPGGRPTIGRIGRVLAHTKLLLREGWRYAFKRIEARREAKVHATALKNLENDATNAEADVSNFIAANTLAIQSYKPKSYPRRLTILRAENNLFDSKIAIESGLGWEPIAEAGFDLWDVPGDHLGILEPPNVQVLASRIAELLQGKTKHL